MGSLDLTALRRWVQGPSLRLYQVLQATRGAPPGCAPVLHALVWRGVNRGGLRGKRGKHGWSSTTRNNWDLTKKNRDLLNKNGDLTWSDQQERLHTEDSSNIFQHLPTFFHHLPPFSHGFFQHFPSISSQVPSPSATWTWSSACWACPRWGPPLAVSEKCQARGDADDSEFLNGPSQKDGESIEMDGEARFFWGKQPKWNFPN